MRGRFNCTDKITDLIGTVLCFFQKLAVVVFGRHVDAFYVCKPTTRRLHSSGRSFRKTNTG